jgi:hypothetical protein
MVVAPSPPALGEWHVEETYKGLLTIAVEALKMLALVNGGAAIGVLTYLGNLVARSNSPPHASEIGPALFCYSGGLTATILAFVVAYVTQLRLFREEADLRKGLDVRRLHNIGVVLGVLLALAAAAAFGVGCYKAATALLP